MEIDDATFVHGVADTGFFGLGRIDEIAIKFNLVPNGIKASYNANSVDGFVECVKENFVVDVGNKFGLQG